MNLPAFITASLAYTPTDVQLNLESRIRQIARPHAQSCGGGRGCSTTCLRQRQRSRCLHLHRFDSRAKSRRRSDMLSGEGVSGTQETAFGAAGHVHVDHDGPGHVLA